MKGFRGKKRSDTDRPESDKVKSDLVSSWAYMSLRPLTACQSDLFLGIIGGSGGVEENWGHPRHRGVAGPMKAIQALHC